MNKTFTFKSTFGNQENCFFYLQRYANNSRLAIQIFYKDEMGFESPFITATINIMHEYDYFNDSVVAIENYSENEGCLTTLLDLGIIQKVILWEKNNYSLIPICLLNLNKLKEYSSNPEFLSLEK